MAPRAASRKASTSTAPTVSPPRPPSIFEQFPALWEPVPQEALGNSALILYLKLITLDPASWVYFDTDGALCHEKGSFESLLKMRAAVRCNRSFTMSNVLLEFSAAVQNASDKTGWVAFPAFEGVAVRRRQGMMFVCIQDSVYALPILPGRLKAAVMEITNAVARRAEKQSSNCAKIDM